MSELTCRQQFEKWIVSPPYNRSFIRFMVGDECDGDIVERMYQECPGGVQLHYVCRPYSWMGEVNKLVQFNEIELVEISEETND